MKRRVARSAPADSVEALVDHVLEGFSATTAARGIRVGITEAELVELLGEPTIVHRDQDMGSGRRLTEMWWERDEEVVAGIAIKDRVGVNWSAHPRNRGVTSIQRCITGDAAAKLFREAFAQVKLRLAGIYKKGENKSTFRAPGLSLDGDVGFVATFHYAGSELAPSSLVVNAGVLE
jgi:hypothetical protein